MADACSPDVGARPSASVGLVIIWLNGTHGAGKTTTSALVQQLIPGRGWNFNIAESLPSLVAAGTGRPIARYHA